MAKIKKKVSIHQDSNLLIITPGYLNKGNLFIMSKLVKEQAQYLNSHFGTVYIMSPLLHSFGLFESDKLYHDYTYDKSM